MYLIMFLIIRPSDRYCSPRLWPVFALQAKSRGEELQLLSNVSGAFRPGVLWALMGVSGAGKTTLLNVLAGKKTGAPENVRESPIRNVP